MMDVTGWILTHVSVSDAVLLFIVLNYVAKLTPWKGDDDLVKMLGNVIKHLFKTNPKGHDDE